LILEPEAAAITALKKSSGTGLGANIKVRISSVLKNMLEKIY
jgi:hypothetical protein